MPPLSCPFLDCLTLKTEALCSSEMSLIIYQFIHYTIPEDLNSQFFHELKPYQIYDLLYFVYRKAEEGFKFCASSLKRNIEDGQNDQDTLMLWALTMDWYAKFLVDVNRLPEAFEYFKKAYDLCVEINGVDNEEIVAVLNDLGTICFVQNDIDNALSYLTQAVAIGNKLPDMEDFGSVLINLGTVYMKKGMVQEATQVYHEAWRNAKKHNNAEVLKQANSCLDELKSSQTAQT